MKPSRKNERLGFRGDLGSSDSPSAPPSKSKDGPREEAPYPDPLKDPKNGTPPSPNMNPLLHWGNQGFIRGFVFWDPLPGLGMEHSTQQSLSGV